MKVEISLAKNVLTPTAAASAIDTKILNKYMVLEEQL